MQFILWLQALILSKQLKGKYELVLPAQIWFFSWNINRFQQAQLKLKASCG